MEPIKLSVRNNLSKSLLFQRTFIHYKVIELVKEIFLEKYPAFEEELLESKIQVKLSKGTVKLSILSTNSYFLTWLRNHAVWQIDVFNKLVLEEIITKSTKFSLFLGYK